MQYYSVGAKTFIILIYFTFNMKETKWERIAVIADRFAIPFWIILIIYGAYEINRNNFLGFISLLIGIGALIIDTTFIIKNRKIR